MSGNVRGHLAFPDRMLWFRPSHETATRAVRNIRSGGVILNGSSTWRTDQLAYGGVMDSGIGREGLRYSMRDMTEERMVLFNDECGLSERRSV